MAGLITDQECKIIERECFLDPGTLARDREMTPVEFLYLYRIQPFPELAFHVEMFQGNTALVIYDCGTLNYPRDGWDPLEGTSAASRELTNIQATWAGLHLVRQGGLRDRVGEDMAVVMTAADMGDPRDRHRWSWSILPGQLRGLYSFAPRSELLDPVFVYLPPEAQGQPSPGKAMESLSPRRTLLVQSILFQGATTCLNHDGAGLLRVATSLQSSAPTIN